MLTKEQIIEAKDITRETVDVPEWGGQVCVTVLSAFAIDEYKSSIYAGKGELNMKNITARLCALCIIDPETGKRIFGDDAIPLLGRKSGKVLKRISEVAERLNGLSPADMKELEKNSGTIPSEDLPTD